MPKQTQTQQAQQGQELTQGKALGGQVQQLGQTLLPAYQQILAKPGYDTATKTAMTTNTLGGIGAAAGSASDAASRRLASTGNPGGYGALQDKLARDRMQSTATAEAGLQSKFGDVALQQKNEALKGLSNLYGIDANTMAKLLEPGAPAGFDPSQIIAAALGGGAQAGSAAISKP